MTMPTPGRVLAPTVLICTLVAVVGCASMGHPLPSAALEEAVPLGSRLTIRTLASDGRFQMLRSSDVGRRLELYLRGRPPSILALSGGGSDGAFGAGALVGLARGGGRPEFSVVTGVSAGALVAPYAFLGPEWDAEMTSIYTSGVTRNLLRRRVFGAIFGSSIYSGRPLRLLIDRYADDRLVAAIAREAAAGRLLLVATTDFATGEPVIWDLGSVALYGGPDAKRLFRAILLASASVPGMLPPVTIRVPTERGVNEEVHVDGAVTTPFFIAPAPEDLPRSGILHQPAVVRIVIDGRLLDFPHAANASALSIFRRSVSAGLSQLMRTTLEWTVDASHEHGISLEYAAISTSYPSKGDFDFSPGAQRALFHYAAACAQAGRLWIRSAEGPQLPTTQTRAAPTGPTCPADDRFIEQFAALDR